MEVRFIISNNLYSITFSMKLTMRDASRPSNFCVSVVPRLSLQAVSARRRRRIRHQMVIRMGQGGSLRRATPTAARCQIDGPAIPVCVALRRSTAMFMTWCTPSCCPPGTMWILSTRSSTRYSRVTKNYFFIWYCSDKIASIVQFSVLVMCRKQTGCWHCDNMYYAALSWTFLSITLRPFLPLILFIIL